MYRSKSDSFMCNQKVKPDSLNSLEDDYDRRGLSLPTRSEEDVEICEIEKGPELVRQDKCIQCLYENEDECSRFYEPSVAECRTQKFYMEQNQDPCTAGSAFPQMLPRPRIDCYSGGGGRVLKLPLARSDSKEIVSEALSAKERFSKCYMVKENFYSPSCSYRSPSNDQYKQQIRANYQPQTPQVPQVARCNVPMLIRAYPNYPRYPNNNSMCFRAPKPNRNQRASCFCDFEDGNRFNDSNLSLVPQQNLGTNNNMGVCHNNNMSAGNNNNMCLEAVLCIPNEITIAFPHGSATQGSWPNECTCLNALPTPPDNNND